MNSAPRLEAIRRRLAEEELSAAVITRSANVTYLTGFDHIGDEEDPHVAVVTRESAILYTDSRYIEAASAQAEGTEWKVAQPAYPYVPSVAEALRSVLSGAGRAMV